MLQQLEDPSYGDYFNRPMFFKTLLVPTTLLTFGSIGNALFLLLSGYFTCSGSRHINLAGTGYKLLTQLAFASIMLLTASPIVRILLPGIRVQQIDITHFNGSSWYIGYYFVVILIAALYVNRYLGESDQTRCTTSLIVLFALSQFTWSGSLLDNIVGGGRQVCVGVFLYALGGYIRRFHLLDNVRTWVIVIGIITLYASLYLSFHNTTMDYIDYYWIRNNGNPFTQTLPVLDNYNVVALFLAIAIFELFRRMPTFHCRLINILGSATFMVYLIHDNDLFYCLWNQQRWPELLSLDKPLFVQRILFWSVLSFLIGVLSYIVYLGIGQLLHRHRSLYLKTRA